jgi:hypothetical protein
MCQGCLSGSHKLSTVLARDAVSMYNRHTAITFVEHIAKNRICQSIFQQTRCMQTARLKSHSCTLANNVYVVEDVIHITKLMFGTPALRMFCVIQYVIHHFNRRIIFF